MEILVVTIFLTAIVDAQHDQLVGPENTLSVVGSNVTMRCSSSSRNCSKFEWDKAISVYSMQKTVFRESSVGMYNDFRSRYSVDNSSGCDLIIQNVELSDAGRFICRAIISGSMPSKSTNLIILKTPPNCTTNASEEYTVEGDLVQLRCEVTYNATTNASMIWKGMEDAPATVENGGTISRSYSFLASAPEIPSFTCETSFAVNSEIKDVATNILKVTCATPAVKILDSVRNVTLSPSLPAYSVGTTVRCTAKGRPPPVIQWQELDDNLTWVDIQNHTSDVFSVDVVSCKRFRCVAMNVVRGRSYKAESHLVLFNHTDESTFGGSLVDIRILGIGIGIGLFFAIVLVSIALFVRLVYPKRHQRPAFSTLAEADHRTGRELANSSTPSIPDPSLSHSVKNDYCRQEAAATVAKLNLRGEANLDQAKGQESAYASLGESRDLNEYESFRKRQEVKPKKKYRSKSTM